MNNQTANIFELLGGVKPEEAKSLAGTKPAAGFDLLLSGLLGLEQTKTGEKTVLPKLPFNDLMNQEVENNLDAIIGTDKELLLDPKLDKNILLNQTISFDKNKIINTEKPIIAENSLEPKIVSNIQNQDLNLVSNNTNPTLTILEPVALDHKAYQILSVETNDKGVSLRLMDDSNPEQTIKINLPKELIENGLVQKTNSDTPRVELAGFEQKSIEKLFKELKVDTLEISSVDSDAETDNFKNENVKLNFVASKADNKLSTIIDKSQLSPVSVKKVNHLKVNNAPISEEAVDDSPKLKAEQTVTKIFNNFTSAEQTKPIANLNSRPVTVGKAAVIDESNSFSKSEKFDLLGITADSNRPVTKLTTENGILQNNTKQSDFTGMTNSNSVKSETTEELNTLFASDKLDFNVSHNDKETTVRPVRFTLPENLNNAQKTGHQSISLKINPDNLGPAKLQLSLTHDDKLRARVMVTSPEAKMALEQSVDRLVDQLNKVNIKVDLIDIHVASENNQEQMFSRQSHWHRKMTNRNLGQEENLDTNDHILPQALGSAGVVNASGVNVLA